MRWLQFIFSHSIFIAFCATALCYQSYILLEIPSNTYVYGLVFFATLCSYNFYWMIAAWRFDPGTRLLSFMVQQRSNLLVFIIASAGMLFCLCKVPAVFPVVGIAVFLTLLYSLPLWNIRQLKFPSRAGFLKTLLLAFTWAFVTVVLPAYGNIKLKTDTVMLIFLCRLFFMFMLCVIFDSRDVKVDKIRSLSSLATTVSPQKIHLIILFSLVAFLLTGFMAGSRAGSFGYSLAMLISGLAVLLIYKLSLQKRGYFFYYFAVDGMMLFSALATFMATI